MLDKKIITTQRNAIKRIKRQQNPHNATQRNSPQNNKHDTTKQNKTKPLVNPMMTYYAIPNSFQVPSHWSMEPVLYLIHRLEPIWLRPDQSKKMRWLRVNH